MNGTCFGTRYQAAVGLIGPIDEGLRNELQAKVAGGGFELRSRLPDERRALLHCRYGRGDDGRKGCVDDSIRVQGAVRFDVPDASAELVRNRGESRELFVECRTQRPKPSRSG